MVNSRVKQSSRCVGVVCVLGAVLLLGGFCRAGIEETETDARIILKTLQAYHQDAPPDSRVLHVVYFHPAGTLPQEGFQPRIQRIMLDIQQFYRDGMARNGFGNVSFPLDMKDGKLNIHVVEGKESSGGYNHDYQPYGKKVKQEITDALKGVVNVPESFAIVFCGMCTKQTDSSYLFYAPYYGDPGCDHRRGLCYVADCELLDPDLLTKSDRMIEYEEHYGTYQQTVNEFNSKYLGGTAHELGHALSLPHNGETAAERALYGLALMGSGNHTYRRERWDDKKGTFMTMASAARLASHPLFYGSRRGQDDPVRCAAEDLKFSRKNTELVIEGRLNALPEVYAVIAYLDPEHGSDYDATAWVGTVNLNTFEISTRCERNAGHSLRLAACHVNGAVSEIFHGNFTVNEHLLPETDTLTTRWLTQTPERDFMAGRRENAVSQARNILKLKNLPAEAERKLKHLLALAQAASDIPSPAVAGGNEVYLSDLQWQSAEVGWGKPARNQYYCDPSIQDALFLDMDGVFYEKGLYAHAPSRYVFKLDKRFKTFRSAAGLLSGVPDSGRAVFVVKGDGRELYRSEVLSGRKTVHIRLDIGDVDVLELITESGKQDNSCCWSIWADTRIAR